MYSSGIVYCRAQVSSSSSSGTKVPGCITYLPTPSNTLERERRDKEKTGPVCVFCRQYHVSNVDSGQGHDGVLFSPPLNRKETGRLELLQCPPLYFPADPVLAQQSAGYHHGRRLLLPAPVKDQHPDQ